MNLRPSAPLLVTCAPGLADVLAAEVEELDLPVEATHRTSVLTRGTMIDAMRLNLRLRTAFAVLRLLDEFRCRNAETLYEHLRTLPWEDLIAPDGYLTVTSHVDTPSINNSMYPSLKVKDAIVDRIADRVGRRPDAGPDRRGVVITLYWKRDRARIYLNTSGDKLADRGYRKIPHQAPMQETLAAAVVLSTGYDGTTPFVNPMCGSGTLAIEAALIAARRGPGLLRSHFGLMHVQGFDRSAWEAERRTARKATRPREVIPPILASDIDPVAIEAARRNATTAGVEHLIEFHVGDFADTPLPEVPGVVILNPAYGLRLGEEDELAALYGRIGDFFKQECCGWTGYVFTGNRALAKCVGLRPARRIPFFSADLECRLLRYEIYAGQARPAAEPRD